MFWGFAQIALLVAGTFGGLSWGWVFGFCWLCEILGREIPKKD